MCIRRRRCIKEINGLLHLSWPFSSLYHGSLSFTTKYLYFFNSFQIAWKSQFPIINAIPSKYWLLRKGCRYMSDQRHISSFSLQISICRTWKSHLVWGEGGFKRCSPINPALANCWQQPKQEKTRNWNISHIQFKKYNHTKFKDENG